MVLMWRTDKLFWITGNMMIMDISLCVLNGLVGMSGRIVYGSIVVNKCIYWPAGIYGDKINSY